MASRDDPYCPFDTAVSLARDWGSRFAFAGDVGHLDASSDLGKRPLGETLLNRLIAETTEYPESKATAPAYSAVSRPNLVRLAQSDPYNGLAESSQRRTG